MMLPHLLLPGLRVDVRVNLCGEDAYVAQHLLHNAEVGAVFDEVRREGMPERVRRNLLPDAGHHGLALHQLED